MVVSVTAACAPVPPATQAPAAASTTLPAATTAPAATQAPPATPTPAIPDPKTDPVGALMYAGEGKLFKTAEFTYTMSMTMNPADDASAKALGDQAAALAGAKMDITGSGAMEVTDAAAGEANMRMDMDMSAAGQQFKLQMVKIGETAWVKMTGQDQWTKVEADQADGALPAGVSPDQMLKDFKNAIDAQLIEDVTRNGEELSHLRFTLDPSQMNLDTLMGSVTQGQELTQAELDELTKDMKPVVDVWLTKSGLELRAEQMTVDWTMGLPADVNVGDAKLRFALTMDMQFANVNEPVTIEAPAGASQ
jgi:hypothetical protein